MFIRTGGLIENRLCILSDATFQVAGQMIETDRRFDLLRESWELIADQTIDSLVRSFTRRYRRVLDLGGVSATHYISSGRTETPSIALPVPLWTEAEAGARQIRSQMLAVPLSLPALKSVVSLLADTTGVVLPGQDTRTKRSGAPGTPASASVEDSFPCRAHSSPTVTLLIKLWFCWPI